MTVRAAQLFFLLLSIVVLSSSANFSAQSSDKYEEEEDIRKYHLPDGFLFGTSTPSYQVEGAYLEDGKGMNNWDIFSHIPGGRFGEINPRGITFYNKIIDNLLSRGIEPFVTIHHNEMPQELEDRYGGWLSPLIQKDFTYFSEICFKSFGDRVKYWATMNEPNLSRELGYLRGKYPPGRCSKPFGNCSAGNSDIEPIVAMHNMLLSHAMAVELYRNHFQQKQGGSIGIIVNALMYEPLTNEESDREAADRALAFDVGGTLDPLIFGDYPMEMRQILGSELPRFSLRERELVESSVDFIGINHYSTQYEKDCTHSTCPLGGDRPIQGFLSSTPYRDGVPIGEPTAMPLFFVVPRGIEKIIDYIKKRYNNKPMFVIENGFCAPPQQSEQVQDFLEDTTRIKFHKDYLSGLARAIRNGVDVRGYFIWSLMDNFEWASGYSITFGLYYVDRQTMKRTPKLSAAWFTDFLTNTTSTTTAHGIKEHHLGRDGYDQKAQFL